MNFSGSLIQSRYQQIRTVPLRIIMNLTTLTEARKELETARTRSINDEKAARLAKHTARAAKAKLKQTRKLAKLARKSARRAEDRAEASIELFERAQARFEKLEKRFRKEQRKAKSRLAQRSASRTKASADRGKPAVRVRSKPKPRLLKPATTTAVAEIRDGHESLSTAAGASAFPTDERPIAL